MNRYNLVSFVFKNKGYWLFAVVLPIIYLILMYKRESLETEQYWNSNLGYIFLLFALGNLVYLFIKSRDSINLLYLVFANLWLLGFCMHILSTQEEYASNYKWFLNGLGVYIITVLLCLPGFVFAAGLNNVLPKLIKWIVWYRVFFLWEGTSNPQNNTLTIQFLNTIYVFDEKTRELLTISSKFKQML